MFQPMIQRLRNLTAHLPDAWAYIAPMAIFMAFTFAAGRWPDFYPTTYICKTLLTAAALVVLWPHFTKVKWDFWWLGVIVGIIGIVQWVGMEKLLMRQPNLFWTRMDADIAKNAFNPFDHFHSAAAIWGFIAFRWAGATLLVPVMEELFWRDFLWRSIGSPNDFKLMAVGEYDLSSFWIVPLVFATVHVQWLTAIVWALMIGLLLLKTKSIGACMIAHGTTNFLLGAYVLYSHEWFFW